MRTPRWLAAGLLAATAAGTLAVAAPASAAPAAGGADAFTYTGTWGGTAPAEKWSTTTGSTATAKVNVGPGGGTISWYGNTDTGGGRATVTVDTRTPVTVDTYNSTPPPGLDRNLYTTPWLAEGPHTFKINVLGTKQTAATGVAISVKGVNTTNGTIVWPGSTAPTPAPAPAVTATATAGSGSAVLKWNATNIPDPATAGVWVQKADGTAGKWYRELSGSHTFTGLTNGVETTLETFVVRDGGGNIASTTTKVTPTGSTTTPPPSGSTELTALEAEALRLINVERSKVGAPALVIDNGMQAVARKHSADMRDRNYFAHTSPDGVTFGQRLDAAGEGGTPRSENIARGQTTAQSVVTTWMNSSGHRANILDPAFRATGLGVATGNGSTLSGPFWTQDFRATASSDGGTTTPPPSGSTGTTRTGFVTGYSYYDNDPPGTSAIAYESVMPNRTGAGGTGTFTDPITAAVPAGTLAPGTKVYVPHVSRYFIVEDECATSHSAPNGCTADLDLWVDGRTAGEASSDACMARITGDYQYIVNPDSGRTVTPGTVCG